MPDKGGKTDLGILKINNEVIASIARTAALQTPGVEGIKNSSLFKILNYFSKEYYKEGICLDINENEVRIEITIIARYGVILPDIANMVQENVRSAIETMTGLSVIEVNVSIADIHSQNKAE